MKILFICKASTEMGFGHLFRSRTLAEVANNEHEVNFFVIGSEVVRKLLWNVKFNVHIISEENELYKYVAEKFDVIIFDMMYMNEDLVLHLKNKSLISVSISPIFNHMSKMDILFSRTKYTGNDHEVKGIKTYLGLKYTIIQKACKRINTNIFRQNLIRKNFSVAISMGGGDAANNTLTLLETLKNFKLPTTFWVLLGEGYTHSYDCLVNTISKNHNQEIILAKTNSSMWYLLSNCVMAILSGGVTTYEAAYAGLPTINMHESERQFFLIKELVEEGISINGGLMNGENLLKLYEQLEEFYNNRKKLLEMHKNSKKVIDGKGSERIIKIIEKELWLY
jgi:spore coat polysaccharide biosynthesis predicted glycosyltransferase SpsG